MSKFQKIRHCFVQENNDHFQYLLFENNQYMDVGVESSKLKLSFSGKAGFSFVMETA